MTRLIGWIGANLLAWCGFPAVLDVVAQGSAKGYSFYFIAMWGGGELLMAYYVYKTRGFDWPLLYNYGLNLTFISIILYYMS